MESISEVIRTARRLTLRTRTSVHGPHSGSSRAAWSGSGLEFRKLRAYTDGDDVRSIDWNSSARTGELLVRDYYEEHNRVFVVVNDCSASMQCGSTTSLKTDIAAHIAATCVYSAARTGDAVGYVSFADQCLARIPIHRGVRHAYRIIHQAYRDARNAHGTMQLSEMLEEVMRLYRRPVGIICISDFLQEGYAASLEKLVQVHDIAPIRVLDPQEMSVSVPEETRLHDPETGDTLTATRALMGLYQQWFTHYDTYFHRLMRRYHIMPCTCGTHHDWSSVIVDYMGQRV